ncbi:hypothetical protein AC579_7837 [Pseudocercospora musae]|uniref:SnoaL-like domain-containing protein n=1 Tax=Pseudocercospora musae TaxID=113226 RepID=A0A139I7A8_9PEZI|nr:hypothetical protein AC579_7837 [Pseudocercospora musae]
MERLIAKDEILTTVHSMNYAEDDLDEQLMRPCFIPDRKITLDNSSHLPQAAMEITTNQWWEMAVAALSGFTGTQHKLSNPIVTFSNENLTKAHLKANVLAYHCIEEDGKLEEVTARGLQEIDLEALDGRWYMFKIETRRNVPLDMSLYEKAAQRAVQGLGRKPMGAT